MSDPRTHQYAIEVEWTGNLGRGTSSYGAYSRDHRIAAPGKAAVLGSSDPAFRGDPARYSPEDLLVGSLSTCHMLWYLHLCATSGIVVQRYLDRATGVLVERPDGGGRFAEVTLRPEVSIAEGGDAELAERLHVRAHELCFIANSVNFPVRCAPTIALSGAAVV